MSEYQELIKNFSRIRDYMREFFIFGFKTRNDFEHSILRLTSEQQEAVDRIKFRKDYLVRGSAGTGKSLVLLKAVEKLIDETKDEEYKPQINFVTFTTSLVKYNAYVAKLMEMGIAEENIKTADSFFKEILDDPVFDPANVKGSLNSIAKSRDDSIPMWRKLIIDCGDILENTDVMALGKDRFIRWNNDVTEYPHKKDSEDNFEIDLIPGSAITGYHAELFSLAKYYELKGKSFNTWGQPEYARAKTNIEQPYFYFGEAEQPYVKVMYQDDDSFRFVFNNGKEQLNVAYADVENALLAVAP